MRPIGHQVYKLTKPAFADRGFHAAAVLTDWPAIVGDQLAAHCCPEKLERDGTLVVRVASGFAVELQHLEPQILDRIATYFGHRAVTRLAMRQGPVGDPPAPPEPLQRPNAAAAARAAADSQPVADQQLRDALTRLGTAIHGKARASDDD